MSNGVGLSLPPPDHQGWAWDDVHSSSRGAVAKHTLDTVAEILETAPDAMLVVDRLGTIRAANQRAIEMFRAPHLVDVSVDSLVPDRFVAGHRALRDDFANDPVPRPMGAGRELNAKRLDGSEFPVEISLGLVDANGEPLVSVAVRDITSRREAEANTAVFGFIVAATGEAIVAVGADGTVSTWNAAAMRLTGRSAEHAIGRPLSECLIISDPNLQARLTSGIVARPAIDRVRTRVIRTDGTTTPVSISVAPIIDKHARTVGATALVRDITEEEEAQVILAEVQARMAETQRLGGIGLWAWDVRSDEVQWSEQLHEIAGVDPFDFAGDLEAHLAVADPACRKEIRSLMQAAADTAERFSLELSLYRPDGGRRWVMLSGEPKTGDDGRLLVRGICQDLTDRHAAEEALREADRMKDEFLGVVSHELRTPLTVILGFGTVLQNEVPEELTKFAGAVVRNATEMEGMVERILDYSRSQAGRMSLQIGDHRLSDLLDDLWPLLESALADHVRTLDTEPDLVVRVDPDAFRHIMVNLLTNAAKFTPPGGPVTVRARPRPGDRCLIVVEDAGPGIPEDELEAVFDRFHQVKSNPTAAKRGAGVGLAIVRAYTEALGGRVWAENRPDAGASLYVELPMAQP